MTLADDVVKQAQKIGLDSQNDWHPEDLVMEILPPDSSVLADMFDLGNGRWESHTDYVFKLSDGSFVKLTYAAGLTESQDHHGTYKAQMVEPYETTVVRYRSVQ